MAIPVDTRIAESDTIDGEVVEFSIGNPAWVMRALSDLYSDSSLAVIREYSTNAYDAELEAAAQESRDPRPIKVTLPSVKNDFMFEVVDHGIGMSTDTLKYLYTSFGDSLSRQSAKANGMLGFGCKSAAAYTNTFTVSSVKDGKRTTAIIDRHKDWTLTLKVVGVSDTDAPNGTTVRIPVHNHAEFNVKAHDFYKFWLPGRVLVDGVEPAHEVGEEITPGLYYSTKWNESRVVMGNVPYIIRNPHALFAGTGMNPIAFTAYLDNGEVEFSNSREDLKYTEVTKATLHALIKNFVADIKVKAQAEIDLSPSHLEAYEAHTKWSDRLGKHLFGNLVYKNDVLPYTIAVKGKRWNMSKTTYNTRACTEAEVRSLRKTLFVSEFFPEVSSAAKRKVEAWLAHKNFTDYQYVIFTTETITSPWIPATNVTTWEKVKAETPRNKVAATTSGRPSGSWDYWQNGYRVNGKPIPASGDVFYMHIHQEHSYNFNAILREIGMKDAIIIRMPGNRLAKFNRDYPNIPSFIKWVNANKVNQTPANLLSQAAKDHLDIDYDFRRVLEKFDISKIDDPVFARYKANMNGADSTLDDYNKAISLAKLCRMPYNVYDGKKTNLQSLYPLLADINFNRYGRAVDLEEVYLYLNAKYARDYKKGN